jgi:hypothetical protein
VRQRTVLAAAAALAVAAAAVTLALVRPGGPGTDDGDVGPGPSAAAAVVDQRLPTADDLVGVGTVRALDGRRGWRVGGTSANTAGSGTTSVCQRGRFADPDGLAALVRTFRGPGARGDRSTVVQSVEVSRSARQAARAYRTVQQWYAGCRVARLQLLDAYRVDGVGDAASVLTMRIWTAPVTTVSVSVARTRAVTTSTVTTTVGARAPGPDRLTSALSATVTRLCARSGAPACVRRARHRRVPPPAAGGERGILAVADLPPVGRVDEPWVGIRTVRFRGDRPTTSCDRAEFFASGATRARTRTYLVPRAPLPARFGLTTTYATFPADRGAVRFLAGVRSSVAGCEERDLATQVGAERRPRGADASAWDLTTEVSPDRDVRFRLGFVRVGRHVAQLTFTPSDADDMSRAAFDALLLRAGDRLRELT